jgi:iron complex outermembrane receptor protein
MSFYSGDIRVITLILFFLLPTTTLSQGIVNNELDEIVVTATRMETSLRNSSRSITVINQDRIQNGTQQLSLDESLVGVPGLYMQNRYNFAQDLRLSLRGFGSRSSFGIRGIKIYVDGIPETLPDGQAGVDSIDIGSIKRIEILRGPSSSLYGNASGGVIAIETELGEDSPFVEATLAGGDLGYKKYQLKSGGKIDEANYLINIAKQQYDGYRSHSETEGTLINGKFRLPLNPMDDLLISFNLTDQPIANDPGGINSDQVASDRSSARDKNIQYDSGESLNQKRVGFVYNRKREAGNLQIKNYYVFRDFSNKLPFTDGGSVRLDRFFYGFGAQYSFGNVLPDNIKVTLGFDIDRQDDDRKRFDNDDGVIGSMGFDQSEKVSSDGLYVQGSYQINDELGLSAGLRYDVVNFNISDHFLTNGDDSGEINFKKFSPSFGLNYNIGSGILFSSWSNSFETPTTTELSNPDGSGGFNSLLNPQTASNFEVGFKTGTNKLYYELVVFNIDLKKELVPYELESFPGRKFFENAGTSSRKGIETAISWKSESGFGVDASYTWSDFTFEKFVDDNGNDFSNKTLPGVPSRFGYI